MRKIHACDAEPTSKISGSIRLTRMRLLAFMLTLTPFPFSLQRLKVEELDDLVLQRLWFQVNQGVLKKVQFEPSLFVLSAFFKIKFQQHLPEAMIFHDSWSYACL